jgi:hypothetical protein
MRWRAGCKNRGTVMRTQMGISPSLLALHLFSQKRIESVCCKFIAVAVLVTEPIDFDFK